MGWACFRRKLASRDDSCSEMYGPCSRITREDVGGMNNMSPMPRSCSAPFPSKIVLESIFDATKEEQIDLLANLEKAKKILDKKIIFSWIYI